MQREAFRLSPPEIERQRTPERLPANGNRTTPREGPVSPARDRFVILQGFFAAWLPADPVPYFGDRLLALALPSSSGELLVEDRYAHVKCLNALSDAKFQDIHDFVDRCSVCERGLDMAARTRRVHVRN